MALKTFNVEEAVYRKFSGFCKEHGMSMSRQVQMFMETVVSEEPEAKKKYLEKLERIRKGKFLKIDSIAKRYGI
ncbi:MAG: hypothetical protein AABY09_03660 [Nanoarchaeota archaeon]